MFYRTQTKLDKDKIHSTRNPILVQESQALLLSIPHIVHPVAPITMFRCSSELKTHSPPTLNPGQIILFWLVLLILKEFSS